MLPTGLLMRGSIAIALSAISLAFVTSVSAECAWVLWAETTIQLFGAEKPIMIGSWTVMMADPSKTKCEADLASKVRDVSKSGYKRDKVEVAGNMVLITRYPAEGHGDEPSSSTTYRFICLPDTIDPRGKKAE